MSNTGSMNIRDDKTVTDNLMKAETTFSSIDILERARQRAHAAKLLFAGQLYPTEAWSLLQNRKAILIDVRTAEERKFVGRVPETLHIAWKFWPGMAQNDQFVQEVESAVSKESVVLLLCRSGVRSVAAAEALTKAGYANAFNILEGFEGELDGNSQRGTCNGWRYAGLPWIQD